jgi:hypothetical protein
MVVITNVMLKAKERENLPVGGSCELKVGKGDYRCVKGHNAKDIGSLYLFAVLDACFESNHD